MAERTETRQATREELEERVELLESAVLMLAAEVCRGHEVSLGLDLHGETGEVSRARVAKLRGRARRTNFRRLGIPEDEFCA